MRHRMCPRGTTGGPSDAIDPEETRGDRKNKPNEPGGPPPRVSSRGAESRPRFLEVRGDPRSGLPCWDWDPDPPPPPRRCFVVPPPPPPMLPKLLPRFSPSALGELPRLERLPGVPSNSEPLSEWCAESPKDPPDSRKKCKDPGRETRRARGARSSEVPAGRRGAGGARVPSGASASGRSRPRPRVSRFSRFLRSRSRSTGGAIVDRASLDGSSRDPTDASEAAAPSRSESPCGSSASRYG